MNTNALQRAVAAPGFPAVVEARPPTPSALASLKELEAAMVRELVPIDIEACTSHHFSDGIYSRQWDQAADVLATSKTHAKENCLVLVRGECVISTGDESFHMVAPHMVKTMPGVKRAVYAVTDITILTFHPNPDNERDIKKLEDRYIIPELFPKPPGNNQEKLP